MKNKLHIIIAIIAAFAGILFGFDTGVISGAILYISGEFHLSAGVNGFVVGSVLIGAIIGALLSGRAADYFGRKKMLIFDALLFIVGSLITALTPNLIILVMGRILVGVAIGIASYTAPVYIAEVVPARQRGALVSLNQLCVAIGILLSYCVDYYFSAEGQWRYMFAAGIVPALVLLTGMLFLPSSPRWKIARGHFEHAKAILLRLRGEVFEAEKEFDFIKASIQHEQHGTWRELFSRKVRPALLIAIGLAVVQQVTGINTILYYAPTVLKLSGLMLARHAILSSIGIGFIFVIGTVLAILVIDRIGRKPLLYLGLVAMFVGFIAMIVAFAQAHIPQALGVVALVGMYIYIFGFSISLGPIVWLLISEIFPLKVRGLGSSLATASNWGSNALVTVTFLPMVTWLGISGTFCLYATLCLLSIVFVYCIVPETKNVALEQVEANLYAGKKARDLGEASCI